MEVLYPRCAGLDVHKDSVVAAVRCVSPPTHHEVRSFATTTQGLLTLAEWLTSQGITGEAVGLAGDGGGPRYALRTEPRGWALVLDGKPATLPTEADDLSADIEQALK